MKIKVECYAGSRYPERPRALLVDGRRLPVEEVEAQARTPGQLRFRVRVSDGRRFSLVYDQVQDAWDVRLAQGAPTEGVGPCAR